MSEFRPGVRRLFRLHRWKREDASRELLDEMELHISLRAAQLVGAGMAPSDAETEARHMFAAGNDTLAQLHETAFDRNSHMQMRERLDAIAQDIRYATRRLLREPLITLFILAILALGIGINVASFSVADRVLLRGPQFVREPDRLVRLYSQVKQEQAGVRTTPWLPYTAFTTLKSGMRTADAVAAYRVDDVMVGSGVASEMRRVSMVSSEMFGLLGVQPVKGRFFTAVDNDQRVAVIGERFWHTTLGSDAEIIGKSIVIRDVPHTIIGIAPAGFTGAELRRVDVWSPISADAQRTMNMVIVARLKKNISIDVASREVVQMRPQIEAVLPKFAGWLRGANYIAAPISYDQNGHKSVESVMVWWLAAISALILFAACANVANLLLARLARRRRELAVRIALGSGRVRVMRLLALEGLLLAFGAAVLAFGVITLIEPVVQSALFPDGSWAFSLLDYRILGAVVLFTLVAGALVSIVPAIQAGRRDVSEMLRGGTRGGEVRSRLRSGLTVVQSMLSVVLLVGAGLFVRSMQRVNAMDMGMQPDRVLTIEVRYPSVVRNPTESFADWGNRMFGLDRSRFRALVDVARRVSGAEDVAATIGVPFYENYSVGVIVPGRDSIPALPGGGPFVSAVGENYFRTIGTALHRGRVFTAADREQSEPVTIVSETMARTIWPREDALGKCVIIGAREMPCARVIGIAADVHRNALREEPSMQYYVPMGQEKGFGGSTLLVRPQGEVNTAWPALRDALLKSDPQILSIHMRVLSQGVDGEMRPLRLGTTAFGLSALLALVVAGLGLYSIMAHAVAWRRHEIGVRLALGAHPRRIASLVVGRGAGLATVGIALGLMVAFGAQPWVQPLLFKTSARDPFVFSIVVITIEAVALLAAWLPARRAVTVSPTEALRAE